MGRLTNALIRSAVVAVPFAQRLVLETRRKAPEVKEFIVRPKFLKRFDPEITRVGQVLAFMFMPAVVIVSLALITALNSLLIGVFVESWDPDGFHTPIFAWLVTAVTLGVCVMFAWSWFQFVRTAGFGMFNYGN